MWKNKKHLLILTCYHIVNGMYSAESKLENVKAYKYCITFKPLVFFFFWIERWGFENREKRKSY